MKLAGIRCRLGVNLQDLWIGVLWRTDKYGAGGDVWICLLPCLPLHIWWWCHEQ